MKLLLSSQPDMILLDLGLPDMDGEEILKRSGMVEMPIIIVSARDQGKKKAALLDLGADDCLTSPFPPELMARIRVALRHLYRQGLPVPSPYTGWAGLNWMWKSMPPPWTESPFT